MQDVPAILKGADAVLVRVLGLRFELLRVWREEVSPFFYRSEYRAQDGRRSQYVAHQKLLCCLVLWQLFQHSIWFAITSRLSSALQHRLPLHLLFAVGGWVGLGCPCV